MLGDPQSGKRLFKGVERFERHEGAAYCREIGRTLKAAKRVLMPGSWVVLWTYPVTQMWVCLALDVQGYDIVARIPWFNAESKPASPGLLASGCEEFILARVPGPPRPLYLSRWKSACSGGRHPRTVVMGTGFGAAIDALVGRRPSGAFSGKRSSDKHRNTYGAFKGTTQERPITASDGGPARFFPNGDTLLTVYGPRARHVHRELYPGGPHTHHPSPKSPGLWVPLADLACGIANFDATPGNIIDPWFGSGSSATAAMALGHSITGIDMDPQWTAEAQVRLDHLNTRHA